jgi:hypothetical protein
MVDSAPAYEPEPHGGTHQWFVGMLALGFVLVVAAVLLFSRSGMDHGGAGGSGRMSEMGHEGPPP